MHALTLYLAGRCDYVHVQSLVVEGGVPIYPQFSLKVPCLLMFNGPKELVEKVRKCLQEIASRVRKVDAEDIVEDKSLNMASAQWTSTSISPKGGCYENSSQRILLGDSAHRCAGRSTLLRNAPQWECHF